MNGKVNEKEALYKIKQYFEQGEFKKVFDYIADISDPLDDFVMQSKYASLIKSIPPNILELKNIRIAILATSTVRQFIDIFKYWLAKEGFSAEIYEAEYNTVHQKILDSQSGLYKFNPEIVIIFTNYRDVKCEVSLDASRAEAHKIVNAAVQEFVSLWASLRRISSCHIIQNNADLPYSRLWGNYDSTVICGRLNMLSHFNIELARAAQDVGVTVFDLDFISSIYGKKKWHDMRFWYYSKHAFDLNATGLVAYNTARIISSIKGGRKKCIVLDLDNTLWGGIIGDDGLDSITLGNGAEGEAFVDFQKFLLKLKEGGIILAVCSKGDEDTAKEPFLNHPDMQLKLDDIVVFKANWNDKASNIKEIASTLNIGLDSIVFIDDSPAERKLVRTLLPMVNVPELPPDPCDYITAIDSQSYFETGTFSEEDKARTVYYRDNIARSEFQEQSSSLSEYLQNLQMEMNVNEFDDFSLPRLTQLINKTNQFNLTTIRYTEGELKSIKNDKNYYCLYFKLKDCFGDNGIISAIILKKLPDLSLYIDTWVMSCRVLSRGAEEFICSEIISLAKKIGFKKITGQYIPTKKNRIVASLYERLNFKMAREENGAAFWELTLEETALPYRTFIRKVNEEK